MSSKSRKEKRKRPYKKGVWKLIDDRSGFEIYSDEACINADGTITSRKNSDPVHYSELPVKMPLEQPLPFTSPEPEDTFVSVTEATYE